MAHFTTATCARCDGAGLVGNDRECPQCTDGKVYTYGPPNWARFAQDLDDVAIVRHDAYRGRPSVRVDDLDEVRCIAAHTDAEVCCDFIGLGALVYPV